MYIQFNDRFLRGQVRIIPISWQCSSFIFIDRDKLNLPKIIRTDGAIIWCNEENEKHNTNGPARTFIFGDIEYRLNDELVDIFMVAINNE